MARGMKVMIDPALPDHRKIRALARSLKIHPMQALGHVVALWCRVMKESPTGVIRGWSNDDIADACKWTGDAARLVSALRLTSIRFIERAEIHDWIEEQGDKVAEREAARKRKAEERERKRLERLAAEEEIKKSRVTGEGVTRDIPSRVTTGDVTPLSRPPVPFPSVPFPSVPSHAKEAGGAPPIPPPALQDVGPNGERPAGPDLTLLAPVQAAANAYSGNGNGTHEDEDHGPPDRADDILRQLLQKADRLTQMPNKRGTLVKYLQAARLRHGAAEVEAWLMDPANRGADVLAMQQALDGAKRKKDRLF